ncbi:expressed unknown protein [Seminavis robusta]|uniref:Uncharacterized protein n=1 Tax=Seminavis robusta TaxID=568900 RepID=A0A9N8HC26_9STRA|nr:expressed unknown protein [Seminavis robusta]|eukprot:Sro361_g126620.1 n/a (869) ;mRNA; r:56954-59627
MEDRVDCRLRWSLDVGGNDNVQFQIPRLSSSSLSLIDDQWCRVPTFGYPTSSGGQWQPKALVDVAIFLPSSSDNNNQIELTIHDSKRVKSTSYQLEINDKVSKMQLLPLPPGNLQDNKLTTSTSKSKLEAFGILLVLTTADNISVFSLVFVKGDDNFCLSECLELSEETNDVASSNALMGRRVRELKCRVVSIANAWGDNDADNTQETALIVVTSSIPSSETGSMSKPPLLHNVDAFVFSFKDHLCPMFGCYKNNDSANKKETTRNLSSISSWNLLKGASYVKNICFLGDALRERGETLVVSVLLAGELKLIPMRQAERRKSCSNNIHMQTILLAGVCAHPSISESVGEALMVQCDGRCLAILCRPKDVSESDFFSSKAYPAETPRFLTTRRKVSFSPFFSQAGNDFFSSKSSTGLPLGLEAEKKPEPAAKPEQSTDTVDRDPRGDRVGGISVVSPESSNGIPHATAATMDDGIPGESVPKETISMKTNPQDQSSTTMSPVMTDASMLSLTSPLVGLHLVGGTPSLAPIHDSTASPAVKNDPDLLDLTGKFASSSNDVSPLSTLILDQSHDEESFEMLRSGMTPARTPIPTNQLGPRSALKRIHCPATSQTKEDACWRSAPNPDTASHVIVVKVEQAAEPGCSTSMPRDKQSANPLKLSISTAPLPLAASRFDMASLKWGANNEGPSRLYVATSDGLDAKSKISVAEICCTQNEDDALRVVSMTRCDIKPVLDKIKRERDGCNLFVKAISLSPGSGNENPAAELQLLLSKQPWAVEDCPAANTPINVSSVEDVQLCLASVSLPLGSSQEMNSATTVPVEPRSNPNDSVVLEKLNDVLHFLQRLEEKVDAGMSDLNRRMRAVEESLRTV